MARLSRLAQLAAQGGTCWIVTGHLLDIKLSCQGCLALSVPLDSPPMSVTITLAVLPFPSFAQIIKGMKKKGSFVKELKQAAPLSCPRCYLFVLFDSSNILWDQYLRVLFTFTCKVRLQSSFDLISFCIVVDCCVCCYFLIYDQKQKQKL